MPFFSACLAIRWAIEENPKSTYLRFVNVPSVLPYRLPDGYRFAPGRGAFLREGKDILFIGYGPILLAEAFRAAELLAPRGIAAAVVDLPWLNRVDPAWLRETVRPFRAVVTLDNHYVAKGQGEFLASSITGEGLSPRILMLGVREIPACGSNDEVLKYHKLDAPSLAEAASGFM